MLYKRQIKNVRALRWTGQHHSYELALRAKKELMKKLVGSDGDKISVYLRIEGSEVQSYLEIINDAGDDPIVVNPGEWVLCQHTGSFVSLSKMSDWKFNQEYQPA